MSLSVEFLLLVVSILLLLAILAGKVSGRVGVPALAAFLALGMLAGSDGPGGIYFDNPWLTQLVGTVALAYILFAGGLETRWRIVRPVFVPALALSTVGVALTTLLVGGFAIVVLKFSPLEGFLLGAIVSSTDAAAVFSILRSRDTRLRGNLEPLLETESGSNDPMAIFLTLGLVRLLTDPSLNALSLIPFFLVQFGIGGLAGFLLGKLGIWLINALELREDGLYPVVTTALVILIYGLTASLGGNGFLAVYLAGIVMGNGVFVHRRSLTRYHDGLAWLMQIAMFLVLGLQVFPSRLPQIAIGGVLIAVFLMLVARPLSVFLTLQPFRFNLREKLMISWVGLRGAAPIVLATFPLLAGLEQSSTLFHIVFFVVLLSVLLQGSSLPLAARLLRVCDPEPPPQPGNLPELFLDKYQGELVEMRVMPGSPACNRRILEIGLPDSALLVLIQRDQDLFLPRGDILLLAGDRVLVASDRDGIAVVRTLFGQ
ncbi:MAG: potassium/proton antiporter [Anaerolineales bacterium]|nr:potassium/proton antiporter [Anaerolineales bacterium]MCX7755774.1 potassium/proton antiporter [Anaerolineales bacterium]MDW8279032.1 potassium/proton antiporter [Anaerolineales bacterium]